MTVRALDWVMTCKAVLSSTFLHQRRMLITPRRITRLVAGMVTIVTYVDLLRVGFLPVITVWHFRTVTAQTEAAFMTHFTVRSIFQGLVGMFCGDHLHQSGITRWQPASPVARGN